MARWRSRSMPRALVSLAVHYESISTDLLFLAGTDWALWGEDDELTPPEGSGGHAFLENQKRIAPHISMYRVLLILTSTDRLRLQRSGPVPSFATISRSTETAPSSSDLPLRSPTSSRGGSRLETSTASIYLTSTGRPALKMQVISVALPPPPFRRPAPLSRLLGFFPASRRSRSTRTNL